jgi:membrane-bound lytic murein transglycosylase A
LSRIVRQRFKIYRTAGDVGNTPVLFTGYYEPICDARLESDDLYRYPLYRKPSDLNRSDKAPSNRKRNGTSTGARTQGKGILPYYTRYEIEREGVLTGRNLEIAWLSDPFDVLTIHIQGSAKLRLANGRIISVGYSASNGRPYRSIGRYLLDKGHLSSKEMSMQSIRRHLSRHPAVLDEVLKYNPSYIFFQELAHGPVGNLNVPLTPGRSIALDYRLFPRGALAYISCRKPILSRTGEIKGWTNFSRFVLNQDTGAAIKGPRRADLYWGSGPQALIPAGHLKHRGNLYILVEDLARQKGLGSPTPLGIFKSVDTLKPRPRTRLFH